MTDQDDWRERLKEIVERWTLPRQAIADYMAGTSGHVSARDILDALKGTHPGLGLATVYRTLELLHELGFLHKTCIEGRASRYELAADGPGGHHHHLICTRCGRIIDYRDFIDQELELIRKTEAALSKRHDFLIRGHNIEFFGLCARCR